MLSKHPVFGITVELFRPLKVINIATERLVQGDAPSKSQLALTKIIFPDDYVNGSAKKISEDIPMEDMQPRT